MRCSFKSIHDRCAEAAGGNAFRNDKVDTERVEFAEMPKKIGCSFSQVLTLT
jgi:hypothetical protein